MSNSLAVCCCPFNVSQTLHHQSDSDIIKLRHKLQLHDNFEVWKEREKKEFVDSDRLFLLWRRKYDGAEGFQDSTGSSLW
jgi:hypothetical protein